jgi:hypothetical protein
MTALSQRDPRWKDIKLGTSKTTSIGSHGCTISSLGYILKTTPDVVNKRLNEVGGYANTNLVIWEKLSTAFPQIQSVKRVRTYNNDEVAANLPCLVEVDGARIGAPRHWVVYIGNQQMMDPWYGNFKSTNYYPPVGYTIIKLTEPPMSGETDITELRKRILYLEEEWNKDQERITSCRSDRTALEIQVAELKQQIGLLKNDIVSEKEALKQEVEQHKKVYKEVTQWIAETLGTGQDWAQIKAAVVRLREGEDNGERYQRENIDLKRQIIEYVNGEKNHLEVIKTLEAKLRIARGLGDASIIELLQEIISRLKIARRQ